MNYAAKREREAGETGKSGLDLHTGGTEWLMCIGDAV
jgi:hypothetical protein